MYATSGVDPAGLLARPAVGLVGPYRDADADADAGVEAEQARVTTSEEDDPSPTPGRENWRLQSEGETVKRVMTMTELWPKDWGMYHEQPGAHDADSLNESAHARARAHDSRSSASAHDTEERGAHMRKTRMMAASTFSHRDHVGLESPEPFSQLWVSLSSLYGQLIVVLMLAFCLTEVMDNAVKMLSLQGIFLMYLYVGSIAVIICIYGWVLVDSCASLTASRRPTPANVTTAVVGGADADAELAEMSLSRFGSLKRAHLGRGKSTGTSFYLRIGALAFGLGTLVFNGLEVAMHSMMEGSCLNDVIFVHPVLHGLFTFLQMHFLFVNSQVLVERFGLAARFGFMHLAATNLALWARLVVWESGNEWTYFVHLSQGGAALSIPTPLQLRGFPRSMMLSRATRSLGNASYRVVSDAHIAQVVALHECLNTNSLGQLWTASMPFLYPFIVQFSLIAAAVTYVMGQNVGRQRLASRAQRYLSSAKQDSMHRAGFTVDCGGASKGLFLGLLALVAGTVVIIIFLVVKEDLDFPADTIFWLTSGSVVVILAMALVVAMVGLAQIRRLSVTGREPSTLDTLLSTATSAGVALYAVFGLVVGGAGLALGDDVGFTTSRRKHAVLLAASALQLAQAAAQATLVAEALRRACLTRQQMLSKPGRQAVTFLLCANAVLWAFDTFVTQSWLSQELQLRFFGVLAWGVVSRIGLPLLVFFRFHSCVLLLEVWKRSYRTRMPDVHTLGAGGGGGGPGVGAGN